MSHSAQTSQHAELPMEWPLSCLKLDSSQMELRFEPWKDPWMEPSSYITNGYIYGRYCDGKERIMLSAPEAKAVAPESDAYTVDAKSVSYFYQDRYDSWQNGYRDNTRVSASDADIKSIKFFLSCGIFLRSGDEANGIYIFVLPPKIKRPYVTVKCLERTPQSLTLAYSILPLRRNGRPYQITKWNGALFVQNVDNSEPHSMGFLDDKELYKWKLSHALIHEPRPKILDSTQDPGKVLLWRNVDRLGGGLCEGTAQTIKVYTAASRTGDENLYLVQLKATALVRGKKIDMVLPIPMSLAGRRAPLNEGYKEFGMQMLPPLSPLWSTTMSAEQLKGHVRGKVNDIRWKRVNANYADPKIYSTAVFLL